MTRQTRVGAGHVPSRKSASPTACPRRAWKLGIGINSAYAAAKSGDIPTVKIGDRVLVPRAALTAMLAKAGA